MSNVIAIWGCEEMIHKEPKVFSPEKYFWYRNIQLQRAVNFTQEDISIQNEVGARVKFSWHGKLQQGSWEFNWKFSQTVPLSLRQLKHLLLICLCQQTYHYWTQENPQQLHQCRLHSVHVSVWCGVTNFGAKALISLKNKMIVFLYGEATHQHIWRLETLRTKRTKLLCTLPFLLRCRDHNTIPRFLQLRHHINSDAANGIYRHTSFSLLQERIHYTRHKPDMVSRELLKLQLLLASTLSAGDWDLIDRITNKKVLWTANDGRARHCRTFMQLHKTQHPSGPPNKLDCHQPQRTEEAACSALSKGLNHAMAPRHIPVKDFLYGWKMQ
jgi:hypothetical protein